MTKLEMIVKALNNEVEKLKKETDNTPADTTFIRSELKMIIKALTDEVANLKNERKKISSEISSFILVLNTVSVIIGVIILIKILI